MRQVVAPRLDEGSAGAAAYNGFMGFHGRLATLIAGAVLATACSSQPRATTLRVQPLDSPVPAGARVPELHRLGDGALLVSWMEARAGGGYTFRMAVRRGEAWSEPRTIVSDKDVLVFSASLPAVAPLPGGSLLAYWETRDHRGDDPYAGQVTASISRDEGNTWSAPFVPHRDGVPGQHAFISSFPVGAQLGLVWLDARRQRYVPPPPGKGEKDALWLGGMSLVYTTIDPSGRLGPEATLDPMTCECCPTAAAVSARGPVVAYRDRSDSPEGTAEVRHDQEVVRDIYVTRLEAGRWTAPRRVHADNWVFNGCPDNGPAVAAEGDRVVVAWWTAPEGQGAVKLAFSSDAGESFSLPVRVDGGFGQGQVTVALAPGGAVVGWLESGKTQARFAGIDGRLGPVTTLGPAAHHARLPRWPSDGRRFVAAWSEGVGDEAPRTVRLARLDLE